MKESNRVVQKKQAWSDANCDGLTGSCAWSKDAKTDGTRRAQSRPDPTVHRMNRSAGDGLPPGRRRASADFQLAVKSTRSAHTLSRSRDIVVLREPRRATSTAVAPGILLLPPIAGSTATPRKGGDSSVVSASVPKSLSRLSNSIVTRETPALLHVLVARNKKTTEVSDQSNGSVRFRAGVNNGGLFSESCSGPGGFDWAIGSPGAASTPAMMELKITPQKSDDACAAAAIETNTGRLKAEPQRALCWDDSDVETESQCSEGNGTWRNSHWLEENDEYYTYQKIAEWVGTVNSTLFNTSKDNLESLHPVEEQDVSTIKIIYDGD
ncbi:hypothetical protein NHX12_012353 [Muraenolepis orangiensis]|uniref:Uncharacterized protein n=1 Tax=Muraenolepis orangiensis TaxID=630683 RepID=A0A9Q0DDZ7_9TELE|nr:hypothetical protein NHX12_012353 [Muraenolepis orangiensis]